jgi:hypothetical protein
VAGAGRHRSVQKPWTKPVAISPTEASPANNHRIMVDSLQKTQDELHSSGEPAA